MSESDSDESSSSSVPMPLLMPHPLHQAIADGDLDEVKRQIADLPVDRTDLVADNGRTGYTPLARAAFHGQVNIVKWLIGEGADVNYGMDDGRGPLHHALTSPETNDHVACAKVLLAAGADVNANAGITGMSPLELVVVTKYNNSISSVESNMCRRLCSVLLHAGATISYQWLHQFMGDFFKDDLIHPYLEKVAKAGGFKAYVKAHRQQLVTMFVRTRCFQQVPDEIVPLIVDYGFHVGFY